MENWTRMLVCLADSKLSIIIKQAFNSSCQLDHFATGEYL